MTRLLEDVRYAFRQFRKNPGFTATIVLTLALGIGANTAIFTVIEAVLLHSLPYPNPERIVHLQDFTPKRAENPYMIGVPRLEEVRSQNQVFEGVAYEFNATLALPGKLPERVRGDGVSGDFWKLMGVQPLLRG
jgi:putative ABC transport system permease protein